MVQSIPGLRDGRRVAKHADRTMHFGQVAAGHNGWRLVVDSHLETGRAPIDELNRSLGLDIGDGGVDVFGYDVASVEHTACHVFAAPRVALDHLVMRLEACVGQFGHSDLFVGGLFHR